MTDSKLLDSSIWLSYLINGNHTNIIEMDEIFLLSVLSLISILRYIFYVPFLAKYTKEK